MIEGVDDPSRVVAVDGDADRFGELSFAAAFASERPDPAAFGGVDRYPVVLCVGYVDVAVGCDRDAARGVEVVFAATEGSPLSDEFAFGVVDDDAVVCGIGDVIRALLQGGEGAARLHAARVRKDRRAAGQATVAI